MKNGFQETKKDNDERPFVSLKGNEFMSTQMTNASLQEENTNSQKDLHLEDEFIVKGLSIQNGIIMRNGMPLVYSDKPIEILSLSVRPSNALRSAKGFSMISDLVQLKYESLNEIRNMGKKSVLEIVEKLNAYLDTCELQESCEKGKTDSKEFDDVQTDKTYKILLEPSEMSIENSSLSIRAKNCLLRSGIRTVEQLINTPIETIRSIRNCGPNNK